MMHYVSTSHAQTSVATKASLAAACLAILAVTATAAAAADRPNVVLIFADDLGYGDLGCYGATKVQTPNIDRLAREGRMFSDAHSASAVCTPSRYALLTGEYPLRGAGGQGIWGPLSHTSGLIIDTKKTTLGQVFKNADYKTACIGKWHLGFGRGKCDWNKPLRPGPLELGFDYYFGVPKVNSGYPYVYVENDRIVGWDPDDPLVFKGKPISPTPTFPPEAGKKTPNVFAGAVKAHEIYHDERTAKLLTEKAVDWIESNKRDPFFLYLPTTNIHHPFTPAPRFKGTSQCGLYGDFIHELDWMVGEVLSCLDNNEIADNTLVIFTSDNGGMFNVGGQSAWAAGHEINGELLGFKFSVWEGGHRVPFIARWPGRIKASTKSNQLICNVDMVSTFAALTGQPIAEGRAKDSVNVFPALIGDPAEQIRDHVVLAPFKSRNLGIRKGKWMYIGAQGGGGFTAAKRGAHAFGGPAAVTFTRRKNSDIENGRIKSDAPPAQLYDLEKDVSQTTNVYSKHPAIVKELSELLRSYPSNEPQMKKRPKRKPPQQQGKRPT
jgi:arylsulfatase A-like enzyme